MMQRHQEQHFLSDREFNLVNMLAVHSRGGGTVPPQMLMNANKKTGRVGIATTTYPKPGVVITPTSTPPTPIRLTQRKRSSTQHDDEIAVSPSPVTAEYYENSTWRMYDRIQASRPPPLSIRSHAARQQQQRQPSSMVSMPRYSSYNQQYASEAPQQDFTYASSVIATSEDEDEELIFDLEL